MQSSSETRSRILKALSAARSLPRPELPNDVLIVSSPDAVAAAKVLYVGLLSAGSRASLVGPTEASVLIMPYREFPKVVIYALSHKDNRAVRAVEEAAILGSDVYFVAPPIHEVLEARISRYENVRRVEVPPEAPLMTMIFASVIWSPKPLGTRASRVQAELEALDGAVEWAEESYRDLIAEVSALQGFSAFYTPSVEPGARYLCQASGACHGALPLEELQRLSGDVAVMMETTAESHDYMDLELLAGSRGLRLIKVLFNTDPLTAGVYSALFGALASGKVI